MRKLSSILLLFSLALFQGCVSDNPQFDRILQSLPSFMIQMGTETLPPGGDASYLDNCLKIAIDPQDEGIYCAGTTRSDFAEPNGSPANDNPDAVLVKFDRNRKLLWARQLGAVTLAGENAGRDRFSDLAFDSKGYIYAAGSVDGRAMVAKFHRKGTLIWRRILPESLLCRRIQIRGDRIFCGGHRGVIPSRVAQVYEVYQDGTVRILRELSTGDRTVSDMDIDPNGNFILTGHITTAFDSGPPLQARTIDFFIWKVSPDGSEKWYEQFGTVPYSEYSQAIVIDGTGAITIGGYFEGSAVSGGTDDDFKPGPFNNVQSNSFAMNFRDTGTGLSLNWKNTSDLATANYVSSLALTKENQIMVGGSASGNFIEMMVDGNYDAFITKLSPDGVVLNQRKFSLYSKGRIGNELDQVCNSIAVDPIGNVICGGATLGNTDETLGGEYDIMIWRVGPNLEF